MLCSKYRLNSWQVRRVNSKVRSVNEVEERLSRVLSLISDFLCEEYEEIRESLEACLHLSINEDIRFYCSKCLEALDHAKTHLSAIERLSEAALREIRR